MPQGKNSKSKRKSKPVKRLKVEDGTLMSDDRQMFSRKVSLSSNNDESKVRTVREIAGSFEIPKIPDPSPTGMMEEDETDIEETSEDEEAFTNEENDDEDDQEVDLNSFLRQLSKQMKKSDNRQKSILRNIKGMKTDITKTNEKIDTNQAETINEMKSIGKRIDKLEEQVNHDREQAKEDLNNYIQENKRNQEMKDKENDEKLNDVRSKINEIQNLVQAMKEDERPMLPLINQSNILQNKQSFSQTLQTPIIPQPGSTNTQSNVVYIPKEKPKNKFASAIHEASTYFADYRRRLAVRVDIEDFRAATDQDISGIAPSVLFRDPAWETLRYRTLTRKLSINTHIPESQIRITDLNISSVNFDIAWIRFESEIIVKNIYMSSAKVQSDKLHMFPVIPSCGTDRKKFIENLLKKLQTTNKKLRYQIRLGDADFKIFVKEYNKGEYSPYREIPMEILDPNEQAPEIRTDNKKILPEELPEPEDKLLELFRGEETDWKGMSPDQRKGLFKLLLKKKNKQVSILQISEFLSEFLAGTKTLHHQHFLSLCPETLLGEEFSGL